MKYLESDELVLLSNILANYVLPGVTIEGKIEVYTCKRINQEKLIVKTIDSRLTKGNIVKSNLGCMNIDANRKLFIDLILTMNTTFPDYDFTNVHPDLFHQINEIDMMQCINSYLGEITLQRPTFLIELYKAINDTVTLKSCSVYSFQPRYEAQDHPFYGALWSFNFFFFNKDLKRICYFTCIGSNKVSSSLSLQNGAMYITDLIDMDDDGNEDDVNMSDEEEDHDDETEAATISF